MVAVCAIPSLWYEYSTEHTSDHCLDTTVLKKKKVQGERKYRKNGYRRVTEWLFQLETGGPFQTGG